MSSRRTLVAALAWCGALALLVLVPASSFAATAGGDEFSLSDLVPLGSAVLGGALTAGATLAVARKTANAQLQQAAGTLIREQQQRMAMDMQTLAEQAAGLYDRLLNAVENGLKDDGVGPITQAIIDLSRRRHFIVDPELRKRTNDYLKVAAEILQTEDHKNARELARDAAGLADSISERAGELYVQAMGATDLSSSPAQGREREAA